MRKRFAIPFFISVVALSVNISSSLAQTPAGQPAATPQQQVAPAVPRPQETFDQPSDPSLNGQYRDMLMRSRTQDFYKLINTTRLSKLWSNTMDSLRTELSKRIAAEKKLSTGLASVNLLRDSLDKAEASLAESQTQVNELSLLGVSVEKGTYNLIMWGIILALAIALTVTCIQSVSNRKEARYRIKLFEELSEEFQTHKVKANEKEKKLARELQDERNKLEEILERNKRQ